MGDMSPARGRRNGAGTGIAKNIKYLYFCAVKLFKLIHDPQPIQGLFGENPDMAESCGLNFEDEVAELNFPSILRELGEKFPFAACFFAFEIFIFSFGLFPFVRGKGLGPDGLRRRADETVWAKLLQLLKCSGIQQLVVELVERIVFRWRVAHECDNSIRLLFQRDLYLFGNLL